MHIFTWEEILDKADRMRASGVFFVVKVYRYGKELEHWDVPLDPPDNLAYCTLQLGQEEEEIGQAYFEADDDTAIAMTEAIDVVVADLPVNYQCEVEVFVPLDMENKSGKPLVTVLSGSMRPKGAAV